MMNEFLLLHEAREIIETWRGDYNGQRPHSSLGQLTPIEFASLNDKKIQERNPERLTQQPLQ